MAQKVPARTLYVLLLIVGILVIGVRDRHNVEAGQRKSPVTQAGNLLQNPGFEGNFRAWSGIPEIQVAANWTPWWWEDPNHNPAYFRPEYKRALASVFPKRVLSGESAQQWFTFHASHVAGMYQQVFNVTPGQHYRFSIWAQVWSSTEDNPNQSVSPANPHLQIGIDPTGNWSPGAATVIWSAEAPMSGVMDQWGLMVIEATAANDVITVFMRTSPDFANKHNDMYWDNAGLEAVQPPQPTVPPSPTPGPATNTPEATNTLAVTNTPQVVATATTAATATTPPTSTPTQATPTPTQTSTPTATNTGTSTPTDTPEPTTAPTATSAPPASPTALSAETISDAGVSADVNQNTADQVADETVAGPDNLGAVTLVAIGAAMLLLLALIVVLIRGMRTR